MIKRRRKRTPEENRLTSLRVKALWQNPEYRAKLVESHVGKKHKPGQTAKILLAKKGYKHTPETIEKIRVGNLGKYSPSGNKHYNWKGGINYRDKHSLCNPEYRVWRKGVFARDKFKCRIEDKNCKGMLQAHHILRWADYPELRYQTNNGITLCQAHHPRKRAEEKRLEPLFKGLVSVLN